MVTRCYIPQLRFWFTRFTVRGSHRTFTVHAAVGWFTLRLFYAFAHAPHYRLPGYTFATVRLVRSFVQFCSLFCLPAQFAPGVCRAPTVGHLLHHDFTLLHIFTRTTTCWFTPLPQFGYTRVALVVRSGCCGCTFTHTRCWFADTRCVRHRVRAHTRGLHRGLRSTHALRLYGCTLVYAVTVTWLHTLPDAGYG